MPWGTEQAKDLLRHAAAPEGQMELTSEQRDAMQKVIKGADVADYAVAQRLREVQRNHPELIVICPVMGDYSEGWTRQPYFGAKLTRKGVAAISQ
jgi:hypothetical protein